MDFSKLTWAEDVHFDTNSTSYILDDFIYIHDQYTSEDWEEHSLVTSVYLYFCFYVYVMCKYFDLRDTMRKGTYE